MSEQPPQYEVGQVVNGYSWNGVGWDPVATEAAPVDTTYQGPGFALPPGMATTQQYPAGGQAAPPRGYAADLGGPTPARAAATLFWLGVLVAVGVTVAGFIALHSLSGGIFWFGGYVITFALWRRAWAKYQATSYATGQGLSTNARLLLAAGGLIAVVPAAFLGVAWAGDQGSQSQLTETVGSCWAEDGSQVVLVACSDSRAQYVAVQQVSTGSEETSCPSSSVGSVVTDVATITLCLQRR